MTALNFISDFNGLRWMPLRMLVLKRVVAPLCLKSFYFHLCLIGFCLVVTHSAEAVTDKNSKPENLYTAATLVVFNNADPMSVDLAGYYAEKRGIPFDHLIGLDCPLTEEISRQDYGKTIEDPLRKIMTQRGWWRVEEIGGQSIVLQNKIRFVALMRGMPLKIASEPVPSGRPVNQSLFDSKDEASVDSEMAALGFFSQNHYGLLKNPYYRSYSPMLEVNQPDLMLVCRLDAADAPTVKRMIDDSIEVEKTGLRGMTYVDARGITDSALMEGDQWLFNLARSQQQMGIPVVLDHAPALFPQDYPMEHAAFIMDGIVKMPRALLSGTISGSSKEPWLVIFIPSVLPRSAIRIISGSHRFLPRGRRPRWGMFTNRFLHLPPISMSLTTVCMLDSPSPKALICRNVRFPG